eukprot:TRINITY_DN297_c0_g1_i5.p1 TRINITY_DN297_c0_g1~~TRINITY_DN297_c0_g1_i5.p1  ORF type:complete len:517 (-),score=103.37 TRINITY_DN297_c0_g1_i5:478-2028(-)
MNAFKPTIFRRINPFSLDNQRNAEPPKPVSDFLSTSTTNSLSSTLRGTTVSTPTVEVKPTVKQDLDDKKDVNTEISRYDSLRDTAQELMRKQVSSSADVEQLTQKVTRLQELNSTQADNVKSLVEEKTRLQTMLESEQEALSKLKFDVSALTTLCDRLKLEVTKFGELVSAFESDKSRLDKKQKEFLLLLENQSTEISSLKAVIVGNNKSIGSLNTTIDSLNIDIQHKEKNIDALTTRCGELSEEIKQKTTYAEQLSVKLDESQQLYRDLEQEKTNLLLNHANALNESEKVAKQLNERILGLQEALETSHSKLEEFKMSMEETKQIIVDQNAQINSIGENLEHKAECLKVAEGKIRQLEQTCNQLRDELLALSTKLERESITYQEEKNLYSTQVEDLMKNLEGLKIIVEEKEAEISSLNIKLDIAMTDKARIIALDQERSNNVLNLEKQVQILSDRIEAITLEKEHLVLIHQEEKDEAASKLQETCDSLKIRVSNSILKYKVACNVYREGRSPKEV